MYTHTHTHRLCIYSNCKFCLLATTEFISCTDAAGSPLTWHSPGYFLWQSLPVPATWEMIVCYRIPDHILQNEIILCYRISDYILQNEIILYYRIPDHILSNEIILYYRIPDHILQNEMIIFYRIPDHMLWNS